MPTRCGPSSCPASVVMTDSEPPPDGAPAAAPLGMGTAGVARRLHPVTPVFDLVEAARRNWPIAVGIVVGRSEIPQAAALAGLTVVLVALLLRWSLTTYTVGSDALSFSEGLLSRRHRTVPYDRVQQVDVVRQLRHRVLGVARLQIETAGGQGSEVALDVLSLREAERLRRLLSGLAGDHTSAPRDPVTQSGADVPWTPAAAPIGLAGDAARGDPDHVPDAVLIRLALPEVVLAGVTGAKLLVVVGTGVALLNIVDDLPRTLLPDLEAVHVPMLSSLAVVGLILAAVLGWFGLAAAASVLSDFGFTLVRRGNGFLVKRGLLERREVSIPVHRVQVVVVTQSVLRRLVRRAAVRVQSAAGRFAVPLVPSDDAIALVCELLGARTLPDLRPSPPAALRRLVLRRAGLVAASALLTAIVWWPAGSVAVVLVPIAAATGWTAWRRLGHGADARLVVARSGALYRRLVVVPVDKAQSTRVTSTPFQRRAGLATLRVDVAGAPPPRVPEIELDRAVELARRLVASAAMDDAHDWAQA